MKNLKVWKKLALLGLVFLIPLVVAVCFFVWQIKTLSVDITQEELAGIAVADPLLDLARDLQQYRALSHAVARGADFEKARDLVRRHILDEALPGLAERAARTAGAAALLQPARPAVPPPGETLPPQTWAEVSADCRAFLEQPAVGTPGEQVAASTSIIREVLDFLRLIGDRSKLTLDPSLDTFYLQNVLIVEGPELIEKVAHARALTAGLFKPQPEEHAAIRSQILDLLKQAADLRRRAVQAVGKAKLAIAAPHQHHVLRIHAGFSGVGGASFDELRSLALDGSATSAEADFREANGERLMRIYDVKAEVGNVLRNLLEARIEAEQTRIYEALAAAAAGILFVGWLGTVLMRDIIEPLDALAATARAIAEGDTRIQVTLGQRGDEIGDLADALQHMLTTQRGHHEKLVENNLEMLKAKEEAQAADRAKRDFLAVMSHEIRTPLNGIVGMTELLVETSLDATQHDYLRTVQGSADHLLMLVNDILDFSKIEAGRLELDATDFELRELLGDAIQALSARAAERGLELNFHVRPDVPDDLIGDSHRLRQVIINLVGNALKFTPEGEVHVSVDAVHEDDAGAILRFAVRDTGIGIAPEVIGRLFSAFEQADNSTTRRYGGTGLGLAITKRIVELMGGTIKVESEVGKGTVFSFTARFAYSQANCDVTMWNDLPRLRVLCVDDNATNLLILRELLTSWRMQVAEAARADAALALLSAAAQQGSPIELVITDMMMPDLDGFDFVERIRADPALRDVRVIMLTSTHRPGDIERAEQLQIAAHLGKPIRQAVLMDTIAEVFGRARRSKHTAQAVVAAGARQRPLRILLAEDNALNQRIARLNLEKWGHHVTVAGDGVTAVERIATEPFDLVLMDSQMPRMGGLEATVVIRQREPAGTHVPIIAMTANVLAGFREECFAAGMDGFVAKPIKREDLITEMARVLPDLFHVGGSLAAIAQAAASAAAGRAPQSVLDLPPVPRDRPFDRAALLASVSGDMSVLREMLDICLEQDAPRLFTALDEALAKDDASEIEHAAHAIKGLVSELHAPACREAARGLEQSGHEQQRAQFADRGAALRREFARLIEALRAERDSTLG